VEVTEIADCGSVRSGRAAIKSLGRLIKGLFGLDLAKPDNDDGECKGESDELVFALASLSLVGLGEVELLLVVVFEND